MRRVLIDRKDRESQADEAAARTGSRHVKSVLEAWMLSPAIGVCARTGLTPPIATLIVPSTINPAERQRATFDMELNGSDAGEAVNTTSHAVCTQTHLSSA